MFACDGKRTSENATRTGLLQLQIQKYFSIEQFAIPTQCNERTPRL
jgi:hypothetical protein